VLGVRACKKSLQRGGRLLIPGGTQAVPKAFDLFPKAGVVALQSYSAQALYDREVVHGSSYSYFEVVYAQRPVVILI
jgi:hypothetical protein